MRKSNTTAALPQKAASPRLFKTRLLVKDFRTTFLFYRDGLGLTPCVGGAADEYAEFETGGARLALQQSESVYAAPAEADQSFADQCDRATLVYAVPDVDEVVGRLQARGIAFLADPQDDPAQDNRTAYLRDPEGNLIELSGPIP